MALHDELRQSLDALKSEITRASELNDDHRDQLNAILGDISGLLDGEDEHSHEALADRLGRATVDFEDSHPDLTLAVGSLAHILSRMGI